MQHRYEKPYNLSMWFFDPLIDWNVLTRMMDMLRDGGKWCDASRWFFDLALVNQIDLDFNHLLAFSKYDKAILNPSVHVRAAFLAPTPLTFGMVRMYEGLMADANIFLRNFKTREECATFLAVPLNILQSELSAESSA